MSDRDESMATKANFSIHVAKESLKFSAAHFIAYPGFREPLHGHNYQVGVYVEGRLAKTGYVIDFGLIKKLTKEIVDRLDERTIIPANSDCLTVEGPKDGVVRIRYENDEFVLPAADVCIVPIVHSSAEELARYIWEELAAALGARGALKLVTTMEISVAEGPGQSAHYRDSTGGI
jgi:6-pyruvoyltetrahydropterin/6-carboxytetrahydropterin synthase